MTEPSTARALATWIAKNVCVSDKVWKSTLGYTVNIAAAFQVVDAMNERGYWAQMRSPFGTGENNDGWWCGFTPHGSTGWNGRPDHWTSAPTLPLAICRAAHKTLTE